MHPFLAFDVRLASTVWLLCLQPPAKYLSNHTIDDERMRSACNTLTHAVQYVLPDLFSIPSGYCSLSLGYCEAKDKQIQTLAAALAFLLRKLDSRSCIWSSLALVMQFLCYHSV